MRKAFGFIKFTMIVLTLYYAINHVVDLMLPQYNNVPNVALMIDYGFITGYIFFIVFILLIHTETYQALRDVKPKISRKMHLLYIILSLTFLSYAFTDFDIRMSFVLIFAFMALTTIFDIIVERWIQLDSSNLAHPKKII